MTATVSYDYCARNLLDERYHYMYTPFAGEGFLRAYLEQRSAAIEDLGGAAQEYPDSHWVETLASGTAIPALAGPIETLPVLAALLRARLHDDDSGTRAWEELFMRKFEVSKRVYERYDERLRGSGQATALAPYALLAALFALRHRQDGDVRALNTLLKLDDLIVSAGPSSLEPAARAMAAWTIQYERRAIQALLQEHAIRVD